jgi:hypothetical protein
LRFLSRFRIGRWAVWLLYHLLDKPLPVSHAAGWMRIPEHSVEQVLDDGALGSLYPGEVLETARRMDCQRHEYDEQRLR